MAKHQVPTLTLEHGYLLWSGIVDDAKVDAVVNHIMGDRLFSGWGVRTLATEQAAFNPLSYHDGTVRPHDNGPTLRARPLPASRGGQSNRRRYVRGLPPTRSSAARGIRGLSPFTH